MPRTAKVDWYGKRVMGAIENATPRALTEVAMEVLARARINIQANGQIDTGFMLNSGQVIGPGGPQGAPASSGTYRSARTGRQVQRTAVPFVIVPRGAAAVHFAACYSIFQEMRRSFLYKALEQVIPAAGGIVQQVVGRVLQ